MELVENNTMTNKDVLKKEKEYLNNIKPKYKEIYGDKGVQFCEDENNNENKIIKKEENRPKTKVTFSSIVQYSRN